MTVDRISVNLGEKISVMSAYHKKDNIKKCFCLNYTKPEILLPKP